MRNAPPVNAELPQAASRGAISSIVTEAPCSLADKAAQVAAFPAPTTITSRSAISIFSPLSATAGTIVVQGPGLLELLRRSKIPLGRLDPGHPRLLFAIVRLEQRRGCPEHVRARGGKCPTKP